MTKKQVKSSSINPKIDRKNEDFAEKVYKKTNVFSIQLLMDENREIE